MSPRQPRRKITSRSLAAIEADRRGLVWDIMLAQRGHVVRVNIITAPLVAVITAVVAGQDTPYVGRWNLKGTGPDTDKVYWLEVKANGTQLEGRFLNRSAHATPLAWIRVENNELVFQYGRGEGTPD